MLAIEIGKQGKRRKRDLFLHENVIGLHSENIVSCESIVDIIKNSRIRGGNMIYHNLVAVTRRK